jgi:hypothetical protein
VKEAKAFHDILRKQSGIVALQQFLSQHNAPATRAHDPDSDTNCWIGSLTISFESQLVSNEGSQSLLWHSKLHLTRHILRAVHASIAYCCTLTYNLRTKNHIGCATSFKIKLFKTLLLRKLCYTFCSLNLHPACH